MLHTLNPAGEPAKIFLKDGSQQFGLLLNDVEKEETFDEGVYFIPNNNISKWVETAARHLIQVIDPSHVEGIDLYMK
ncbi:MAG: hypothetical protein Fur0041_16750 [Bacteroidia bacterium]